MMRCDYCEYRNSWNCDDGWYRVSNNQLCEEFKLDYSTLSDKQKKEIQKRLMRKKWHEY